MRVTAKMLRDAGWVRESWAVRIIYNLATGEAQQDHRRWQKDGIEATFHEAAAIYKQQMKEKACE